MDDLNLFLGTFHFLKNTAYDLKNDSYIFADAKAMINK